MAEVILKYGKNVGCNHVMLTVTIDKETRHYIVTQDDLKNGVMDKESQFETIKNNVLTNTKLQVAEMTLSKSVDLTAVKSVIDKGVFQI